ncbi:MAG: hypothetical protein HKM89_09290 [Gemmatimonadales bacterium]|nr:hypothetical protein [Gemmatimonadales bacterium]
MTNSHVRCARLRGFLLGIGLLSVGGVGTLTAQTKYPNVSLAGRLQQHFYFFDNGDYAAITGPESGSFTRRARITAKGQIAENISFIIVPSFEDGKNRVRLRDAYIDVRLTKPTSKTALAVRVGQEKRPFNRYELTSSNNLPSLERGAGRGLVKSSSNDLFLGNGFGSHDIGAALRLMTAVGDGRVLAVHAGVYNGEGESTPEVNSAKSFGVRATLDVTDELNVGGSFFSHDGIVDVMGVTDSSFTNQAFGIDAQWGKPGNEGVYLVGDFMRGEDDSEDQLTIWGLSLVGAYHVRVADSESFLFAVEPAVRVDLSDPDTDTDDDGTTIVTAGVNFYLSSKTRFQIMYENQSFQASGLESIQGIRTALAISF